MSDVSHTTDTRRYIYIQGARLHNLKNISVAIPRNRLVVITGLSGSGKSTLAFDTLFAEGQRRYVESLSAYARQFLGKMNKPEVDFIKGISPAVAIQQKVTTRNPRSTVGTSTEIYDYLKLLFARTGRTYSPVSGKEVKRHSVSDVVAYCLSLPAQSHFLILAPLPTLKPKERRQKIELLIQQGFSRILSSGKITRIEELHAHKGTHDGKEWLVIDRITSDPDQEENTARISDSVQSALFEGNKECAIAPLRNNELIRENQMETFSSHFEMDGITFEEPDVNFFSFNNPVGACKTCEGYGSIIGIDENMVIPDDNLSVFQDAVACWRGEVMSEWKKEVIKHAAKTSFPVHKPYKDLSAPQRKELWEGNKHFSGIRDFFRMLEQNLYKIQYRVMLARYRGKTLCPDCKGTRLRRDATYVCVGKKNISELVLMPVHDLYAFFHNLKLNEHDEKVARRILLEIRNRLQYLMDVGLGYLTLNRLSNSLSGGESQRINLATSLGSSLVGSMYILDEPSIGLHPRDTHRLIKVLQQLRDIGNTVIVVEHDEEIMQAADEIIDIGPDAGSRGGELVFQGTLRELVKSGKGWTAAYLGGAEKVPMPVRRRILNDYIEVKGAAENNLKKINVRLPLNGLVVVTGVSGSGKSTLVRKILYNALRKRLDGSSDIPGKFTSLGGSVDRIEQVEFVDQNPIGKSSRSNPVTYVKAYDEIRSLFCHLPLSKLRGYKPSHFSFNVEGGRCDQCHGEGEVIIEMQFMADIHLPCDSCGGKRFKQDILEVVFMEKNAADILEMTVSDAMHFFRSAGESFPEYTSACHRIVEKLRPLDDVGLGYVHLGQSSSTLSGGEAQRIKLASFIGMGTHGKTTLFIFDEPTTGLHFHDIRKLLLAFDALIHQGHSILVIEHNAEVIKCADWIIDMGPEGGEAGGEVVFAGKPEDLVKKSQGHTARFLKDKLK
ncbi:MAG: excinuclease ABC subunit UvrA [Bacteroidia bacterium]|nr:excinuclease ABC subunit UvrA [Bacteroidia bacterium]